MSRKVAGPQTPGQAAIAHLSVRRTGSGSACAGGLPLGLLRGAIAARTLESTREGAARQLAGVLVHRLVSAELTRHDERDRIPLKGAWIHRRPAICLTITPRTTPVITANVAVITG